MAECYDVAVLGAGIQGSSTAWYLSKHCGKKVVLLEQFALNHIRGSSHGPSRIIRYMYPEQFYVSMMLSAYPLWHQLEKDTGIKLMHTTGGITIYKEDSESLREMQASFSHFNLPYSILSAEEINKRYPGLKYPPGWTGLYDPDSGILDSDVCREAFLTESAKHGTRVRQNSKVSSIRPGAETISIVLSDGEIIRCKRLVITAGSWAKDMLAEIGVHLPLEVTRVQACYWRAPQPGLYSRQSKFPVYCHDNGQKHWYALPIHEYPDCFKLCAHEGLAIDSGDRRDVEYGSDDFLKIGMDDVIDLMTEFIPYIERKPAVVESCIYTSTPDNDPIIDRHPVWSNIVYACGFSGHGFKLAPVVGQMLSQLVLDQAPTHDLRPFRASRFSTAKI